jgi:hypothetical protein
VALRPREERSTKARPSVPTRRDVSAYHTPDWLRSARATLDETQRRRSNEAFDPKKGPWLL